MSKTKGLDYTLESQRYGAVAANVAKEKIPNYIHEFADAKSSGEFIAVIRRLPGGLKIEENGNGDGRKEICFRDYSDPYTERGTMWQLGDQGRTVFFLTPRAFGLPKSKLLEILDQAEKAIEEAMPAKTRN